MNEKQTTMSQGMWKVVVFNVVVALILFLVLLGLVSVFAGLVALVISLGLLPVLLVWYIVHRIRKRKAGETAGELVKTEESEKPVLWVIVANVIAALILFLILWAVLSIFAAVVGLVIGLGILPVAIIIYVVYRVRKKREAS